MSLSWDSPLLEVKGIGEQKNQLFSKLGIETVGDLLSYYPRAYENRGNLVKLKDCVDGEVHAVLVQCTAAPIVGKTYSRIDYVRMQAMDDTATITVTFFGMRYLASSIKKGNWYRLYGRITMGLTNAEANSPVMEAVFPGKPLPNIYPVYPLTAGMTQNMVRSAIRECLSVCETIESVLSDSLRDAYHLLPKGEAIRILHQPKTEKELEKAKETVAFEELLVFQLALRSMRLAKKITPAFAMKSPENKDSFLDALPFTPTKAQQRAIREVFADMAKPEPMARLVQGDVGSGKTVVAAAALERCVKNGKQAVLLAPTEILAEQHAKTMDQWLSSSGTRIALLTSSVPKKQKTELKKALAKGEVDIVIGTHAAIQEDVHFRSLGLVVTDEQHRFGVQQRAALLDRSEESGTRAHMLVMSATPIPRSLSLVLYGDLDVSILDELPAGRQAIDTLVMNPADREKIYKSTLRQIAQGGQAYMICPLVEENEESPKKAAESYFQELSNGAFSGVPMGLIHGRLSAKEKASAMADFASGRTKVLVSTTVIEVGVDVPNANVMIIENAECFGLSQLHQLRGRIGRGTRKSFCVLINGTGKPNERLQIMKKSSNGFEIAEADLQQRGPGDFFGDRQSGEMILCSASMTNLHLIEETKKVVAELLPDLEHPEYERLRAETERVLRKAGSGKTVN